MHTAENIEISMNNINFIKRMFIFYPRTSTTREKSHAILRRKVKKNKKQKTNFKCIEFHRRD